MLDKLQYFTVHELKFHYDFKVGEHFKTVHE